MGKNPREWHVRRGYECGGLAAMASDVKAQTQYSPKGSAPEMRAGSNATNVSGGAARAWNEAGSASGRRRCEGIGRRRGGRIRTRAVPPTAAGPNPRSRAWRSLRRGFAATPAGPRSSGTPARRAGARRRRRCPAPPRPLPCGRGRGTPWRRSRSRGSARLGAPRRGIRRPGPTRTQATRAAAPPRHWSASRRWTAARPAAGGGAQAGVSGAWPRERRVPGAFAAPPARAASTCCLRRLAVAGGSGPAGYRQ